MYCLEFGDNHKQHLPFDNIMNMLQIKPVSRALIIIDACHSGAATERGRKSAAPTYSPQSNELPRGIAILSSCRAKEVSSELPDGTASVFTSLMCDGIETGLDGKPTAGGVISITDICQYVNSKLASVRAFEGYNQHPAYKVDGGGETIWLARNRSGDSSTVRPAPTHSFTTLEQLRFAYESTASSRWPCDGVELTDLNAARVAAFAERVAPDLLEAGVKDAELADKLGLLSAIPVAGVRRLHNAAVLCFCDNPQKYFPQARSAFVAGDPSNSEIALKHVGGPLSDQVKRLTELAARELRTKALFGGIGDRVETTEVPIDVVREAISNAITHRDYKAKGTIQVHLTDEFIDIINPGSFPPGCTWEER